MAVQNTRLGIILMVSATAVFAAQDAIARHLATEYNAFVVTMIRYWAFAAFVLVIAMRSPGGVRAAAKSHRPVLQMLRGLLLVTQVIIIVTSFSWIGLVNTHAIFAMHPLISLALSGPLLGERVAWRQWGAVMIGMVGVLVILNPGSGVFSPEAILAVIAAFNFAIYGVMTRMAGIVDDAKVSFFWTGVMGAVAMTAVGPFFWVPVQGGDWFWIAVVCGTGIAGHWLMIRTYEVAEASAVQPFAYSQLVFVSILGVVVFNEHLAPNVIIGGAIVASAGMVAALQARGRTGR